MEKLREAKKGMIRFLSVLELSQEYEVKCI